MKRTRKIALLCGMLFVVGAINAQDTIKVHQNGDVQMLKGKFGGYENGYEWVDLGLSVKWATCNVGATKPEESGNYYAWGETETKSTYSWSNYKYGLSNALTKYCSDTTYGKDGFADHKTRLELEDDAAYVNWGGKWHMSTDEDWVELCAQCILTFTTFNGVKGYEAKAANGNSIFLPLAGYGRDDEIGRHVGLYGDYWSNSVRNLMGGLISLHKGEIRYCANYSYEFWRCWGSTIRPVCTSKTYNWVINDTLVCDSAHVITLDAIPSTGYQFTQWSDGNKENPRQIVVTEDLNLSAEFAPLSSNCSLTEISVVGKEIENFSADSTNYKVSFPYGTAESALPGKDAITYTLGDSTQSVVVNQITNKVFTVVVTAQNGATKTYVIEFVIAERTKLAVEVATNDILLGDVAGGDGIYYAGDSAKIGAVAYEGAQFYAWDNGVDQNPYNVLLSRDTTLTAIFLKEVSEEIVTEITETSSEITIAANDSAEYYNHRQYCDRSHECHLVDIKIGNNGKVQEYNWDNNGKHCGWLKAPKKNAETNTISYTIDSLDANTNYYFVVETIDAKGQVIDKVAGSFKTAETTAVKNVTIDGLYVENGRIVCENTEDLRIYTVTGIDVTENNGALQGVYIVKCGDKTSKVVVK